MSPSQDKPVVWLAGEVKTPPFSREARIETGFLLRRLQAGHMLSIPQSRPMPAIAPRCHELRVIDKGRAWRIVYRIDPDAIVIANVFAEDSPTTPRQAMQRSRDRLRRYDAAAKGED